MTPIHRLPREMLLRIFSYVGCLDSLMNYITVCKQWQEPATEARFKEVTLKEFHIRKIKALLGQNVPNQDDYFIKSQWTQKLVIEDYGRDKLELQDFTSLISYLPNLQVIDLWRSQSKSTYMAYLRNIDSTVYLKRLGGIQGGTPRGGQDYYDTFATFYNVPATLTHVGLNYSSHNPALTLGGQLGNPLSFLPNFTALTHFTFSNNNEDTGDVTIYNLSKICPRLESLDFHGEHVPDERLDTILAVLDNQKNFLQRH